MKRYALFIMAGYYPRGGMNDFVDTSDDVESLMSLIPQPSSNYSPNIPVRREDGTIGTEYRGNECFAEIWDMVELKMVWDRELDKKRNK